MLKENPLVSQVTHCAIEVHMALGPGLLESAYQACLCRELQNLPFARQLPLTFDYKGERVDCAYRMDIFVAGKLPLN